MAVNIDDVYQKVLAIANKEQRGYITPQEFNLFANQVQMEIFEQYFYDLNQAMRASENNSEYSDMVNIIEEKLQPFEKTLELTPKLNARRPWPAGGINTTPLDPYYFDASSITDLYRLGSVVWNKYGTNMLLDSDFSSTGTQAASVAGVFWGTGVNWTIGSGKATKTSGDIGYLTVNPITQTSQTNFPGFTPGKRYALTFDVTTTESDGDQLRFVNNLQNHTDFSEATGGSYPSGATGDGDFAIHTESDGNATGYTVIWIQGSTTPTLLSIWAGADWVGTLDNIRVREMFDGVEITKVSNKDILDIKAMPLAKPNEVRPIYTRNNTGFFVYPNTITSGVWCQYIKKPVEVTWGYEEILASDGQSGSTALYNNSNSVHFELHPSEENEIVLQILKLAGVNTQDQALYQFSSSEQQQTDQLQKA